MKSSCTGTFVLFRLNTLPGPFSQLPTAEAPEALIWYVYTYTYLYVYT